MSLVVDSIEIPIIGGRHRIFARRTLFQSLLAPRLLASVRLGGTLVRFCESTIFRDQMVEAPALDPVQGFSGEPMASVTKQLPTQLSQFRKLEAMLALVNLEFSVIDREHECLFATEMLPEMVQ
jgi:hypothetical protein